jgi:hypothetical protein
MNSTQFARMMELTNTKIKELVNTKGREYSGDHDRLRNFKEGGERVGVDPRTVLAIYMDKHYCSITQYLKDKQTGVARQMSEPIDGRIEDTILYLHLLKALIWDIDHPAEFIDVKMREEFFKDAEDA